MMKLRFSIPILLLAFCFVGPDPCAGRDDPGGRRLSFWTVGGADGLAKRFGATFVQRLGAIGESEDELDRVLLAVAEEPLSPVQIAERSGLAMSRVEKIASDLGSVGLMRRYGEDRWATTVPVITDGAMKVMKKEMAPIAERAARAMGSGIARMRTSYEQVKSPSDPSWDVIAHLVIDKFVVDGTFHRAIGALEREKGLRALYDQGQQHLPAFYLEQGESFSTFGTNWYPFRGGEEEREVYVLHGAVLDRFTIRLNEHRENGILASAILKIAPGAGLEALSVREGEVLRELEWTDGDRLLVPVVGAQALKALLPAADGIGREAAEALFENFSLITGSFDRSPHARFLDAGGDYIQVCYHILFSLVIERLLDQGALPAIPRPVPEHAGVFIIAGRVFD